MGSSRVQRRSVQQSRVRNSAKPKAAAAGLAMTGYEQSPNHDDRTSARRHDLFLALTTLVIIVVLVLLWFWG
jgi:hypothetical protein